MAAPNLVYFLLLTIVAGIIVGSNNMMSVDAAWCIAKSFAPPTLLQAQLDYACGNGAECGPIQPGGSCFNPNTIYNHASYAFNSFYKRKGSCNFGGTATIAISDPSFGACKYPASLSNAEGAFEKKIQLGLHKQHPSLQKYRGYLVHPQLSVASSSGKNNSE